MYVCTYVILYACMHACMHVQSSPLRNYDTEKLRLTIHVLTFLKAVKLGLVISVSFLCNQPKNSESRAMTISRASFT